MCNSRLPTDSAPPTTAEMLTVTTAAPPSAAETLAQITSLLSHLLPLSTSVKSFPGRWQVLRTKLASLNSSISEISESTHWSENPLLVQTLLPNLLSTLRRVETLAEHCADATYVSGKLLMQSDLDMATGWLSKQIQDLDLLLRSGVLKQSNAIVLSHPAPGSAKEDLGFFIRDLFTRLQIGGVEFKKKSMESLLQLLVDDEKAASLVAKEGDISYLIRLLDLNSCLREQAVSAVSILAGAGEVSRRTVFEEGGLGPLLRIIESGSVLLKEKAAMAVEALTSDPENAWAVAAYGGVSTLVEVCKTGSVVAQCYAIGAIRNVASVEDIRIALMEEDGAISAILQLLDSDTAEVQEKAASCVSILASSSEKFRDLLIQLKVLQKLLEILNDSSNLGTLEQVLRAILALSTSHSVNRVLSSSTGFIIQISELVKQNNLNLQHVVVSLLANLSLSDGNKRAIVGCTNNLVRLMEFVKPAGLQEMATKALVSLLSVTANQKEFVKDEKNVMRLVQMLDPKNELVPKKFAVAVASAVMAGGSNGCRKRLVAAGVYAHLLRLAEMDVAGSKKAVQRFSCSRLKSIFNRTLEGINSKVMITRHERSVVGF